MVVTGLKVLDFSRLLPGPFASRMLIDLGAKVMRVVHPTRQDMLENFGPKKSGTSTLYTTINHGKDKIALDLKLESSRDKVKELISDYDIILEGFRPGVMASLGLGYEELSQVNPELIYCSISGYGQKSQRADSAGHDINYLALSGIPSYSGRDEPPILGTQLADLSGSMYATQSILAAVIQRHQTGEGCYIDVSMRDAVLSLGIIANNDYLNGRRNRGRRDGLLNGGAIYDYYRTSDDRFLSVGSLEPKFGNRLLEILGIDSDFDLFNMSLKQEIKDKFFSEPLHHWIALFADEDACVEPVLMVEEVFEDPDIPIKEVRGAKMLDYPVKFGKKPK